YLERKYDHVSMERVCSGLGLPNLYDFLRDSGHAVEPPALAQQLAAAQDRTPIIVEQALRDGDAATLCTATLTLFEDILAAEASNMALKVLATGGVYVGGGMPVRILGHLSPERFMQVFRHKGRFADMLGRMPVHVITRQAALMGVADYGLQRMAVS
ncbi:MAG: glucokinase, partial [Caldilineaceae bacterium]|nr:glucokinase [Caldilineaceae bacterium]